MTEIIQRFKIVGFVVLLCCANVGAQRTSARDTVVELSRIDTNRALELQIMSPGKSNAVKQALLKQVSDDFRDLQSLHNKMMADSWARPELDYKYISGMVGQIARKAERLKSNLALPEVKQEHETKKPTSEIATAQNFRTEMLSLDRSVVGFVTNPIFQKTNVVELKLANQASHDLLTVIELSKRLKKMSETLMRKEQRAKR